MRRGMGKRASLAAAVAAVLILGTLGVASAGHENVLLFTQLRGRNEVPTDPAETRKNVGDPNGTGVAYVFGIDGDPTTLCYVLTVDRIQPATAAHIHEGVEGTNGPVVVNLAAPADGNAADCLTEGEEGKFVGDQTVAEILANPSAYYVNVHNAEYPNGAIRGQLAPER
ncbi:MAG: CHRD domain-containing protein [Actinobacteria bacterium]|nr:CHRD domain-containing protein [Actinomycetota bacterium]